MNGTINRLKVQKKSVQEESRKVPGRKHESVGNVQWYLPEETVCQAWMLLAKTAERNCGQDCVMNKLC